MKLSHREKIKTIILVAVLIMSFVCLYAGLYLFSGEKQTEDAETAEPVFAEVDAPVVQKPFPVVYRRLSETIKDLKQEINILEIDVSDSRVEVFPVLSHDLVYGFEKLSEMAFRSGAYAAVNGGFFHEYGQPSGMVAIKGKLLKKPTGKYPVFTVSGGRASLAEQELKMWMESEGVSFHVDKINDEGKPGEAVIYTPFYGSSNRAKSENITAVIVDGVVARVAVYDGEVRIPEDGMLLSVFLPLPYSIDNFPFREGDAVEFGYEPRLEDGANAYECGSWIVKDGEVVIGNSDEWIGVTTNRDPRTAVGLKDDKTVVLLTVDGRQPDYSYGLTGKELGELLVQLGVRDAAMLDGGASTEMIVEGRIVNRPSFKGTERPLGGALVVKVNNHKD